MLLEEQHLAGIGLAVLVKSITPHGAAAREGRIREGDRLTMVQGVDVCGVGLQGVVDLLKNQALVHIALAREGPAGVHGAQAPPGEGSPLPLRPTKSVHVTLHLRAVAPPAAAAPDLTISDLTINSPSAAAPAGGDRPAEDPLSRSSSRGGVGVGGVPGLSGQWLEAVGEGFLSALRSRGSRGPSPARSRSEEEAPFRQEDQEDEVLRPYYVL